MTPLLLRLDAFVPFVLAITIVLASIFTGGCAGAPSAAWQTTIWTGAAVEAADLAVERTLQEINANTLAEAMEAKRSGTMTEDEAVAWYETTVHERVEPFDDTRTALRVAYSSLGGVDFALATWDQGSDGEEHWLSMIACAAAALSSVVRAMTEAGVDMPSEVTRVVGLLGAYADGICPNEEGGE